jgi:hypothetical protein
MIGGGKVFAIVVPVIHERFRRTIHIDSQNVTAQHSREVLGDEAIAATNVQNFVCVRNGSRDFERHIVSAPDFPPAAFATKSAPEAGKNAVVGGIGKIE